MKYALQIQHIHNFELWEQERNKNANKIIPEEEIIDAHKCTHIYKKRVIYVTDLVVDKVLKASEARFANSTCSLFRTVGTRTKQKYYHKEEISDAQKKKSCFMILIAGLRSKLTLADARKFVRTK